MLSCKTVSILIKVSPSRTVPHRGDQQSQRESAASSRCYDIILNAPKYMRTRPTFGSKDKIIDAKYEFNGLTEFDVTTPTVSHRRLLNNRTVVDSTNRTASELM